MMVPFAITHRSPLRPSFLLEVMMGAGMMGSFLVLLLTEPGLHRGLLALGYLGLLFLMALHDIRSLRVPNLIVFPALAFSVAASLTLGWRDAAEALLGGAAAFLILAAVAIIEGEPWGSPMSRWGVFVA